MKSPMNFIGLFKERRTKMSEQSSIIFAKSTDISDIESKLKKTKAILLPSTNWTGIALNVALRNNRNKASELSILLDTVVVSYVCDSDYFFEYAFFENGIERAYLLVNFDGATESVRANLSYVKEQVDHPENMEQLAEVLDTSHRIKAAELFLKSIYSGKGLDNLTYQSLKTYLLYNPDETWLTSLPRVKKNRHLEPILDTIGEQLKSYGFTYDPDYKEGYIDVYLFSKTIDDFKYGVSLTKLDRSRGYAVNYLFPSRCNPEYSDYHERGFGFVMNYKSEKELCPKLLELSEDIVHKGLKLLEEKEIRPFDVHGVYRRGLDPFFETYGYKNEFMSPSLLHGGEVVYGKNDKKVIFKQAVNQTNLEIEFADSHSNAPLHQKLSEYAEKYQIYNFYRTYNHLQHHYYYTNEKQLAEMLAKSAEAIKLILDDEKAGMD
ncbi:hypothetical protein [Cohnella hongkongensis]|uniref:Uncharacterized protein n=1 Tax=Cohnella hongkongensis TaxID=178337 RepID=A0ABV9FGV4_9BACL